MDTQDIETITRLIAGLGGLTALIYFTYIEMMHPAIALSDRSFVVLVLIIASTLAIKELQYFGKRNRGDGGGE